MDLELEGLDYYHALIPKENIPAQLETKGDFLIYKDKRPADASTYTIAVNIGQESVVVKEFFIISEYGQHNLPRGPAYDNVSGLIKDLMGKITSLPDGVELIRPVKRPLWKLTPDKVEIGEIIGQGQFTKVNNGVIDWYGKKMNVAVKTDTSFKDKLEMDTKWWQDILTEAIVMRNIDHPNCTKLFAVMVESEPYMLVMELANRGSLLPFLRKETPATHKEKMDLVFHAALALEYLHSRKILHRKITARNCLLHRPDGAETLQLKLPECLLGIDDIYFWSDEKRPFSILPVKHFAPETLVKGLFDALTDVWMYGGLVYEIYSDGKELYEGKSLQKVKERIIGGELQEIPDDFPALAKDLLNASWTLDPKNRPPMSKIIKIIKTHYEPAAVTKMQEVGGSTRTMKSKAKEENNNSTRTKKVKDDGSARGKKDGSTRMKKSNDNSARGKKAKDDGSARIKKSNENSARGKKADGSARGKKSNDNSFRGKKAKDGSTRGKPKKTAKAAMDNSARKKKKR